VATAPIPDAVARLLWDVDLQRLDLDRDSFVVFERVMSRGTWEAMKWLRERYPVGELADFVRDRGRRVLSPRDLAYWALVCDVDLGPAEGDAGGGRPRWAGT
jgi:hypothetical protein